MQFTGRSFLCVGALTVVVKMCDQKNRRQFETREKILTCSVRENPQYATARNSMKIKRTNWQNGDKNTWSSSCVNCTWLRDCVTYEELATENFSPVINIFVTSTGVEIIPKNLGHAHERNVWTPCYTRGVHANKPITVFGPLQHLFNNSSLSAQQLGRSHASHQYDETILTQSQPLRTGALMTEATTANNLSKQLF